MALVPKSTYHHGNARNALLAAAIMLLEREGAHGLSLRQVAEQAGLSRQAPYNHFVDKEALLAELVRTGFARLGGEMRNIKGFPGSKTALQYAAETYIGFAERSPALFRLMFSRELVDLAHFPEAAAAANDAHQALDEIIGAFTPPRTRHDLSLAAWSLVHGYAVLCIETDLEDATARKRRARQFAQLIRGG